jgi:alkanesulfonate monooxygenase SsuD/methylene tetrahydromethanopterin reductase-like flavin-dependent oxidoreductase (luciferase family)
MQVGVVLPLGLDGEFEGWEPDRAWARTVAIARRADEIGLESLWAYDHLHAFPAPGTQPTLEALSVLAAVAASTRRVRLGPLVACAGFRPAALLAKMTATLDVISGGRFELGLGAGWRREEWVAFGYGFPSLHERLVMLEESLEVASRLLGAGRATYAGRYSSVVDAINEPKGVQQPRVPIMVGGNGAEVTWRLAARFADELNLDGLAPSQVRAALPVVAQRCQEVGREPASLSVSVNVELPWASSARQERRDVLAAYRELGVRRVMTPVPVTALDDNALDELAAAAN